MSIRGISYEPHRREAHLIAGEASTFVGPGSLQYTTSAGTVAAATYQTQNTDVFLKITPRFKDNLATVGKHGNGQVEVDLNTGAIRMPASSGAFVKSNFMVDVLATNKFIGDDFRTSIRVHLHRSIRRIWLSPERITVRFFTSDPVDGGKHVGRFAVRAEFDDGTVGDISTMDGIQQWTTPADISISKGVVDIAATTATTSTVSVVVLGQTASGTVEREADWTGAQPSLPVALRRSPVGPLNLSPTVAPSTADVPNVLFISEGYESAEQPLFEQFVRSLVGSIRMDPLASPFNGLSNSMGFWSVFKPCVAGRAGVSIATEVYTHGPPGPSGAMRMALMPLVEDIEFTGSNAIWTIGQLIHAVGLPMPLHALRSDDQLRDEWLATVDQDPRPHLPAPPVPPPPGVISNTYSLFDEWRSLATRGLVDMIDSPLGVEVGELRPDHRAHRMHLHDDRLSRARLNQLFSSFTSPTEPMVGTLWQQTPLSSSHSAELVCIVLNTPGEEAKRPGAFFCSGGKRGQVTASSTTGRRYLLVPPVPERTASSMHAGLVVQQLAQAFTIGSEHGGDMSAPNEELINAMSFDRRTNTQLEIAFGIMSPGTGVGNDIRWRWHRIEEAAMLTDKPVSIGATTWAVRVRMGEASVFIVDAPVHLRRRRVGESLSAPAFMTKTFWVKHAQGDIIELEDRNTPFNHPAAFTMSMGHLFKGDIIYMPNLLPGIPFPPLAIQPRELVSGLIRAQISSTGLPLTPHPMRKDDRLDQIPNLPSTTTLALPANFSGRFWTSIVGLYGGGEDTHLGVFHPTGHCRMRETVGDGVRAFCAVCAYQLIDQINPQLHGSFDRWYEKRYPGP